MSAYCTPYSYSREVAHRQRERERGGWGGIASIVSIGEWISAAAAAATAATFYMPTCTQTCKYCQVLNSTKETTMQQRYYVSIAQLMRRVSTSSSISNCRLCACAGGRVSMGSVASPAERERERCPMVRPSARYPTISRGFCTFPSTLLRTCTCACLTVQ